VFSPHQTTIPRPFDPIRATQLRQEWLAAADDFVPEDAEFVRRNAEHPRVVALLDAVFSNSPFLTGLIFTCPDTVRLFVTEGPEKALAYAMDMAVAPTEDIAALMRTLRRAKARAALAIALADISDIWGLDQVVTALSSFADRCVQAALAKILRGAHERGQIKLADPENPAAECGYIVLGLGKLGANELNYSSDIDLLVLFDPERLPYTGNKSPQEFAVATTKELVRVLEERTGDGYVFRTDLRLRPDPGSTSIAVSRDAAQIYYESYGQNWERAAMIKARLVAGDAKTGSEFLHDMQPFLWRKSLDFYALQDIHSIKRQIYAHKGGGTIQVAGHNIKLGRGGIREVEFFAQTQQLIWGGRLADTRVPQTLGALDVLTKRGFVDPAVRDDLAAVYVFLRRLEHRLQMVADEQTQTLPTTPAGLAELGTFAGYNDAAVFAADIEAALRTVESHYAALFEDAPSLSIEGNLVFTGTEDDPDTMDTLRRLGFNDPSAVASAVRAWHHGRYRATRSDRARQILTEIIPNMLAAFGKTTEADAAFLRFDRCLAEQQSGVQLLSVFQANRDLLDLVAEIMGDAPRLADHLARNPALLDYVLEPDFYSAIPDLAGLTADFERMLSATETFEQVLDISRRWANDQRFRIGVQTLRGLIQAPESARHFSHVAEAVLHGLVPRVTAEFAIQHGTVPGAEFVLLAYGKLGSGELTPTSDLDLVAIYDGPADGMSQGGPRTLSIQSYYMRLTQRLVSALTLLTREGTLYNVDMRLRPSGTQGPVSCSLEAFTKYQRDSAWTWEHMALTRARVVQGDAPLADRVSAIIHETLTRPRDHDKLLIDVADMRARMRKELSRSDDTAPWDVKQRPGGLVDAEFILQYLVLRTKDAVPSPGSRTDLSAPATIDRLLTAGSLSAETGRTLQAGLRLWSTLQVLLRLTLGDDVPTPLPLGLQKKLADALNEDNFADLEKCMQETSAHISKVFRAMIDDPASALDRPKPGTASGAGI